METFETKDGVSLIQPRIRDIGGFAIRRLLPHAKRRMVGPFIFFDYMGPARFDPGQGVDVAPHPHIGLATVTYLFDGEIIHRDSLGYEHPIRPGDVNWMVAGRGIAHSERTAPELRVAGAPLHGIQSWVALPHESEEVSPSFKHHPQDTLPLIKDTDIEIRLIAGSGFGTQSPVDVYSPMIYADIALQAGAELELPPEHPELAVFCIEGAVRVRGQPVSAVQMAIVEEGGKRRLSASDAARVMLLGGAPLEGPRHIWWNFVSSEKARIEQAKDDWRNGRFDTVVGETEIVPLPE